MAVSGLIGRYNLAGLELDVTMPDDLFADVETLVSVTIHNRKKFPTFLLRVEIGDSSVLFPLLTGRSSIRKSLPMTFSHRGQQLLPPSTFRSCFPVNFFVRSFSSPDTGRTTVFPAPRTCRDLLPDDQGEQLGNHVSPRRGGDGDIERISRYSGHEPLKMIHWKLTARQGEMLVKELADSAGEPLILDLDKIPGGNIEQRLSCATWLVRHSLRNNRPVGLQLQHKLIPPSTGRRHRLQLLTELALYGSDPAEA
jgi:uncharacterized protein (DUF58 family)